MSINEDAARLHSRHQPQREAARYIDALNLSDNIDCFILIEPGMGYLISALRERFPDSTVIALHADNHFRLTHNQYPDVPMWFPDSETGVQEFLEETIPETASARLIEWRPSLRVYGDICLGLVRETTEFIRRLAASKRTTSAFGTRWVRNFFRNLALVNQTLLYRTMDMPIVVTGSGPSLESALPWIRDAREGVFVLAASSSLPALITGGVMPDMVIATDGGGWALLHLHACFRSFKTSHGGHEGHKEHGEENKILNSPCPPSCPQDSSPPCLREMNSEVKLACSLSAALPSQCVGVSLLPMNDGSLWQSMALHGIGLPSVLIPQRGTVTASALDLALVLSSGAIFLAGMDLAVRDIRSHARPYAFDHLFFGTASRLRPVYSQCFFRSGDIRAGGSHDVYAAWFKNKIAAWPKRIFSLGGNHAAFEDNLPSPSLTQMTHNADNHFKLVKANYLPTERRRRAVETLIAALDNPQYTAELTGELAPLLFPAKAGVPLAGVSPAEIAETLRSLDG